MVGSRKQTSQRTETNIIIADGENIASRINRRKGDHHVMKIGVKIRQIRQHRHMTQRELGEKIGLGTERIASPSMRWDIEPPNGTNSIKLPTL